MDRPSFQADAPAAIGLRVLLILACGSSLVVTAALFALCVVPAQAAGRDALLGTGVVLVTLQIGIAVVRPLALALWLRRLTVNAACSSLAPARFSPAQALLAPLVPLWSWFRPVQVAEAALATLDGGSTAAVRGFLVGGKGALPALLFCQALGITHGIPGDIVLALALPFSLVQGAAAAAGLVVLARVRLADLERTSRSTPLAIGDLFSHTASRSTCAGAEAW